MVAHFAWDEGEWFKSDISNYAEDSLIGRAVEN